MTLPRGASAVESIYADYNILVDELSASASGLAAINRAYGKHLLLSSASSLEDFVKESVPLIFATRGDAQLGRFVTRWVFDRGYHTLFGWKDLTAQPFFASFGTECGAAFKTALRDDEGLKTQHDAFMLLGSLRNELVHNDFATKSIELTPTEIIEKYREGVKFVERFDELIHAAAK